MPLAMRLEGSLDLLSFEQALLDVILRHEPLRTVITENNGEVVGRILSRIDKNWVLTHSNISQYSKPEQAQLISQGIERESARLFDLSKDLSLRSHLVRLSPNDFVLISVLHHGAADGGSLPLFMRDLSVAYAARLKGLTPWNQPLAVTYADHASWQRRSLEGKAEYESQLAYWKKSLSGAPEVLTLPTDFTRHADRSRTARYVHLVVDTGTVKALEGLALKHGTTLFAALLGVYALLLCRLARQTSVVLGVPVSGRGLSEIEDIVGFFVNSLPMHVELEGLLTGDDLIERAKQVSVDALSHQEIPFERLVENLTESRSLSHSSIFQASFVYQTQGSTKLELENVAVSSI